MASALMVAEYSALREEVRQALDAAQATVRLFMASFGVLFAAGLVAISTRLQHSRDANFALIDALVLLLFGVVIPGLTSVATWTWIGSLHRSERAGAHLRRTENKVRSLPDLLALTGYPPIDQENYIVAAGRLELVSSDGRISDVPGGKDSGAQFGTALLFSGALVSTFIIFLLWWDRIRVIHSSPGMLWWLLFGALIVFIFFGVSLWLGMRLLGIHKVTYPTEIPLADDDRLQKSIIRKRRRG